MCNNSWLKKTYVLAGVHNVECDEEVWEWVSLEANSRLSAIQSLGTPVQNESFHGHCWYRRFSYRALLWISYGIIFMIIVSLMAILLIRLNQFFEYKIWKLTKYLSQLLQISKKGIALAKYLKNSGPEKSSGL